MKIKDFHITGQYPVLSVETEIEEADVSEQNAAQTVRLQLGSWSYVSLLSEAELKSLIHLVYESHQTKPTKAMAKLTGASLKNASDVELP